MAQDPGNKRNILSRARGVGSPENRHISVLSLPGAQGGFVGDPTSLACDNIYFFFFGNLKQFQRVKCI